MPVSNTNTFTVSTANGVTTVFPYDFTLLNVNDLVVTVAGVVVTTGFTVDGIGVAGGGNITFSVAPANGARVLRKRVVTLTRSTDYQYVGALASATLDADFDRLWLAMQQIDAPYGLIPSLPLDSAYAGDMSLPEPVAGGFWRWAADGLSVTYEVLDISAASAEVSAAAAAASADLAAIEAAKLTATAWAAVTPASSWYWNSAVDAATNYEPSYSKKSDIVYLRGKLTKDASPSTNETLFTLPAGFRPLKGKTLCCHFDRDSTLRFSTCTLRVNADGTVVLIIEHTGVTGTGNHIILDGIFFHID